jgi:hypothetical protein
MSQSGSHLICLSLSALGQAQMNLAAKFLCMKLYLSILITLLPTLAFNYDFIIFENLHNLSVPPTPKKSLPE